MAKERREMKQKKRADSRYNIYLMLHFIVKILGFLIFVMIIIIVIKAFSSGIIGAPAIRPSDSATNPLA